MTDDPRWRDERWREFCRHAEDYVAASTRPRPQPKPAVIALLWWLALIALLIAAWLPIFLVARALV